MAEYDSGQSYSKSERLTGPRGAPFAWAESRQELCETLPYYRAYHSGCYATSAKITPQLNQEGKLSSQLLRDCIPYGYLLGGFGASRDAWEHDGQVIISHGGGKSGVEESSKEDVDNPLPDASISASKADQKVRPTGDQTFKDGQIPSLVHSYRCQTPIVLLIAKDYKSSHFELPCAFAVLGWYWITDVWCEREPRKDKSVLGWVRWKFRFQYIQSQGRPWWLGNEQVLFWNPKTDRGRHWAAPDGEALRPSKSPSKRQKWSSGKHLKRSVHLTSITVEEASTNTDPICTRCQQTSPLVFWIGWMCLKQDCEAFWKVSNDSIGQKLWLIRFLFIAL